MFTGIIKEIGIVEGVRPKGPIRRLSIKAEGLLKEAGIGDSISVDGVCLTVVDKLRGLLYFDLIGETLKDTTLGFVKRLEKVNLEPALGLKEGALSGHLVNGHIDEVGRIRKITRQGKETMQLAIGISVRGRSLLVHKGSVAVDGISLTINDIGRDFFTVNIIPHTFRSTTMHIKNIGDRVNIEFDMIGKYALKNLSKFKDKTIDENLLRINGFL